MRLVVLFAVLAAGCSKSSSPSYTVPKPTYPAPTSIYQGRSVSAWGKQAADIDQRTCGDACSACEAIGQESVPFVVAAAELHQQRGAETNLIYCLDVLLRLRVAEADAEKFAPLAEDKWPEHIRTRAIKLLAASKVRSSLPRMKQLAADKNILVSVEAGNAVAAIEGR